MFKTGILCLCLILLSCGQADEVKQDAHILKEGMWRFELAINEHQLPFNVDVYKDSEGLKADVINAEERITIKDIREVGDSLFLTLPLYDSEFQLIRSTDGGLSGVWRNFDRQDYTLPLTASHDTHYRF